MKRTLLSMVQSILSDMDSEDVNAIGDSIEAQQVASVIEDCFYNIVSAREIPEHQQLLKLTALSDIAHPTHFQYPTDVKSIDRVFYNTASTGSTYVEIYYINPLDFITRMDESSSGSQKVLDKAGGTDLFVLNNVSPTYYTSFDDNFIVFDSYNSAIDTTLQESKSRAYGSVYPSFTISDSFEPDLDDNMLPYLLAEAKSTCFSLFKSGSDPKIEQTARRLKSYVQNDMHKTKTANRRPNYGKYR
jgi:hypothetical protein|tara:strand:+ start:1002 stop:1736 length:735 start_codon:yes stop_codon:yes gene_type:complete